MELELFSSFKSSSSDSSGNKFPSDNNTDLMSSSSGPTKFTMVFFVSNQGFLCEEVVSIDSICHEDGWSQAFQLNLELSNTRNKVDVILDPCLSGEKICMRQPRGVSYPKIYPTFFFLISSA